MLCYKTLNLRSEILIYSDFIVRISDKLTVSGALRTLETVALVSWEGPWTIKYLLLFNDIQQNLNNGDTTEHSGPKKMKNVTAVNEKDVFNSNGRSWMALGLFDEDCQQMLCPLCHKYPGIADIIRNGAHFKGTKHFWVNPLKSHDRSSERQSCVRRELQQTSLSAVKC